MDEGRNCLEIVGLVRGKNMAALGELVNSSSHGRLGLVVWAFRALESCDLWLEIVAFLDYLQFPPGLLSRNTTLTQLIVKLTIFLQFWTTQLSFQILKLPILVLLSLSWVYFWQSHLGNIFFQIACCLLLQALGKSALSSFTLLNQSVEKTADFCLTCSLVQLALPRSEGQMVMMIQGTALGFIFRPFDTLLKDYDLFVAGMPLLLFCYLLPLFFAVTAPVSFGLVLINNSFDLVDEVVEVVVGESGKFPLPWKPSEGLSEGAALDHEIEQLGILVPLLLPAIVVNLLAHLLPPLPKPYPIAPAQANIKRGMEDDLPKRDVLQIEFLARRGILLWIEVVAMEGSRLE